MLLHHVTVGEDSGLPSLLLIHPMGADLRFWDDCLPSWQARHRCIACDLRSAGGSPRGAGPPTIAEHVDDLVALQAATASGPVVAVACAVGSMPAIALAARHPAMVAGLVLANATASLTAEARVMLRERAEAVRRGGLAAVLPSAVERPFLAQPKDDRYRRYYDRFAAQDAHTYADAVAGFAQADVEADLAAVRCPTLVVAGAHDTLLPPARAEHVHRAIAGARYLLFEEAAHFLPYQAPERFAAAVLDFASALQGSVDPSNAKPSKEHHHG